MTGLQEKHNEPQSNESMLKRTVEHTVLEIEGQKVPAKIYREVRRSVRFSIAAKGAIMRMPLMLPARDQQRELARFRDWVRAQVAAKQQLRKQFTPKQYRTGSTLTVGNRTYTLTVEETDNRTYAAKRTGENILLRLASGDDDMQRQKAIKHLLSRIVAQDFLPAITARVLELNQLHFQKNIRSVNLKYNRSNWGSCSSKGNINLSTRLLFAPSRVIDYVIVHELAHLVELNHSPRYWQIVERIMPDYTKQEAWLKDNWEVCDF